MCKKLAGGLLNYFVNTKLHIKKKIRHSSRTECKLSHVCCSEFFGEIIEYKLNKKVSV